MADDLFTLPFDQYHRYRLAAEAVETLAGGRRLSVIEVGGFPPRLGAFLPAHDVVVTDRVTEEARGYLVASGLDLPFPDRSHDAAVTLDTLEHVKPTDREKFIDELVRVAESAVILACPFDDPAVRAADRAVHDFVLSRSGYSHRFLKEHLEIEPPNLDATIAQLEGRGFSVKTIPAGRLDRWMNMMLLYYALDADDNLKTAIPPLMSAYNRAYARLDRAEPAYRRLLAAARGETAKRLGLLESLAPDPEARPPVEMEEAVLALETARSLALAAKDRRIGELAAELSARGDRLEALAARVRELENFDGRLKNSAAYRVYLALVKPFKKR